MSGAVSYERVRDQLHQLKLESALSALDPVLEQGQKSEKLPVEILDELLGVELAQCFERRVKTNPKLSGLPRPKTLEEFDFDAQPQVPRDTVRELATLRFLHQGENVLFLGPFGRGKTHLAVAIAYRAIQNDYEARLTTANELIGTLSRAAAEGSLEGAPRTLSPPPRPRPGRAGLPELRPRCRQRALPRGQRPLSETAARDRHHQQAPGCPRTAPP